MEASTNASSQSANETGNKPVVEKLIEIHPEKKPTIILNDFVETKDIFNSLNMGPSFDCSKPEGDARMRRTHLHAFIETILLSYVHHLPLILSPDDIWVTIQQGFGLHVEKNAEKLRSKFVSFQGKKELWVIRNEDYWFLRKHDWAPAFGEWASQIKENIGEKNHSNLVPKFSTTGPLQQQVFDTCLMNSMESYFVYCMGGGCGIPVIKMLGTLDDWETLRKKTEALDYYGCAHWVDNLLPILDKFILAYKGEVDKDFWDMCIKCMPSTGSGGFYDGGYSYSDSLTGWVLNFFPYQKNGRAQYAGLEQLKEVYDKREAGTKYTYGREMTGKSIPQSFIKVPFIYHEPATNNQRKFDMTILTGFCGMSVTKDNFVRPQIGWSIHCFNSKKKVGEMGGAKGKGKAKAPAPPSKPWNQIKADDRAQIQEWATKHKIDITHLTDTKKMKFGPDASKSDENALRDAWYRHEEVMGQKLINDMVEVPNGDIQKHFERRRMKFMGKRLKEYFEKLPAEQYPEEMKTYIEQVINGEAELTQELRQVYNAVAMPTKEAILAKQEEEKKQEEKSLALPKTQKEEKKRSTSTNRKTSNTRSTSKGRTSSSVRR